MNRNKPKSFLRQYWILYFAGFVLVFGLKLFYSRANTDSLMWILTPTTWWVRVLSGAYFEPVPGMGYINHDLQFIIAKSCSGVQFMTISVAALTFSFVHRFAGADNTAPASGNTYPSSWNTSPDKKIHGLIQGFGWIILSLFLSFLFTVLVNGLRIVLSFELPPLLESAFSHKGDVFYGYKSCEYGLYSGWLTPERLHTLIGTVVYFSSLFVIYYLADLLSRRLTCTPESRSEEKTFYRLLPPAFWYLFIVLGIPLLNRAYQNNIESFTEYATLILPVCTGILTLLFLTSVLFRYSVTK